LRHLNPWISGLNFIERCPDLLQLRSLNYLTGCFIESATYWPTEGWRTSTPEQQGLDSEKLVELLDYVQEKDINIHSLLIIRNGYVVTDVYFYPSANGSVHDVASVTKSFTGALIGIAISEGYIAGVDRPVLEFFPNRTVANVD